MLNDQEKKNNNIPTPIQDMMADAQKNTTWGPLIGSAIIVVLMIVAALYFWSMIIQQRSIEIKTEQKTQEIEKENIIIKTIKQSDSDELEDIETDLRATDLDLFDDLLLEIEREF